MPEVLTTDSVQQKGQDLIQRINGQIERAVQLDFTGPPNKHPIIVINAIKNIIGDDRNDPANELLEFSDNVLNKHRPRDNDSEFLDDIQKEGIGLTIFVDDVEEAILSGNKDLAESETATQLLASDHSPAILETFTVLALHDIDTLGLFTFHWLRSYQFHQNKSLLWSYSRSMLNQIFKGNLQHIEHEINRKPRDLIRTVLLEHHQENWSTFAAMFRYWDGDYVRIESYQYSISQWLEKLSDEHGSTSNVDCNQLKSFVNTGGRFFIELAKTIVDSSNSEDAMTKIVELEGMRGIAKKLPEEYFPQITNCINFITR